MTARYCSECGGELPQHKKGCSKRPKAPTRPADWEFNAEAAEKALEAVHLLAFAASEKGDPNALGDYCYNIRDAELEGWEGPRVVAWGRGSVLAAEAVRMTRRV